MKTNSADITTLDFSALVDLSTGTPTVTITNLSIAPEPDDVTYLIELLSPSGTKFYQAVPTSAWSTHTATPNFPKPNGVIEWSSPNPYIISITATDGVGQSFTNKKEIKVTKPNGWKPENKNTFGQAYASVEVKCAQAKLWVEDRTSYLYQGKVGTPVSKKFSFVPPVGNDGIAPAAQNFLNFNSALISIAGLPSSEGYQYVLASVLDYAFPNGLTLRIKYLERSIFSVYCNVNLDPVWSDFSKLLDEYEKGTCKDREAVGYKLKLISGYLSLAANAVVFPQCGKNPMSYVEKIKKLTGWDCDCCSTGIHASATIADSSAIASYEVVKDGGDIEGYTEVIGTTLRIHLKDRTYIVAPHPETGSEAIEIIPQVAGQTTTYLLKIDTTMLADEILTTITENTDMLNTLNEMLDDARGGSSTAVRVDPKCILPVENLCEYTLQNEVYASEFVIRTIFYEDGASTPVNFLFKGTDSLYGLEMKFINIGFENWTFVYNPLGRVVMSGETNRKIKNITYSIVGSDTEQTMTLTKKCDNATHTFSPSVIIQALINYACQLSLATVKSGRPFDIKRLIAIGGEIKNIKVRYDASVDEMLNEFIQSYNSLVDIVHGIKRADCDLIGTIFTKEDTDGLADTDSFLMKLAGGDCVRVAPQYVAAKVFDMAIRNPQVKALLCKAMETCGTPVCPSINNMTATYNPTTQVLTVFIPNNGVLRYAVAYYPETTGRPEYAGQETINASGATGVTQFSWNGVPAGTWNVKAVPVCENGTQGQESTAKTALCNSISSITAVLDTNNRIKVAWGGVPAESQGVRVEVNWPGGSKEVKDFPVSPTTVWFDIPSGVSGSANVAGRNICSTTGRGWYSDLTQLVTVVIPQKDTCPNVLDMTIEAITATSVKIKATKPSGINTPQSYILRLGYGNGLFNFYTNTNAGSVLEWNITNLNPNTTYYSFIVSKCSEGTSSGYVGGMFSTPRALNAENSQVFNAGFETATQVYVMVNGAMVFTGGPLTGAGSGAYHLFYVNDATNAEVRLTPCYDNITGADAILETNGGNTNIRYNRKEGGTFIWDNVNIVGGMRLRFKDVGIVPM